MLGKQQLCELLPPRRAQAWVELRIALGFVLLVAMTPSAFTETSEEVPAQAPGLHTTLLLEAPTRHSRAFPEVSLGSGRKLQYLGTFCANAKYKKSTKFTRALEALNSFSQSTSVWGEGATGRAGVPSGMILSPQRIVEDFEPPAHATRIVQPKSNMATMRDEVVTFVYGPERVMEAPHQVTTDSRRRVIISDPDLRAVHVFDPNGKTSFSILGDQGHRLRMPAGVAVDAEDNIYIADSERGMVLVYNRDGQFVRYIGMFHGENMYERPTGIAIDRKAGRLYLADTPRNLVFILDLQGNVLKSVGKDRNGNGVGEFLSPTEIAVSDYGITVLDAERSRIQALHFEGNRIGCYRISTGVDRDNGMAVGRDGNIYISYVGSSIIGIYKPDGTLIGSFGQPGSRIGEFLSPRALWVDASNRVYVADTENGRIQVFQLVTDTTSPY